MGGALFAEESNDDSADAPRRTRRQVNIFNLAKNAGTSVEQIERFYARNLPLSAEMARNLQSFGGGSYLGW